ncbi:hypothetical protein KFK09_009039 [Dendrobium nobile]|uniref:Uncharacterized protein n=1 Tax=Dendrobium nobile TaxID=94219 RepID=A0A8T3BRA5_DENNO|nr:hypothetical protein KFK09_009039 [Dendrobium nobile]
MSSKEAKKLLTTRSKPYLTSREDAAVRQRRGDSCEEMRLDASSNVGTRCGKTLLWISGSTQTRPDF